MNTERWLVFVLVACVIAVVALIGHTCSKGTAEQCRDAINSAAIGFAAGAAAGSVAGGRR